jgi:hypothetical protein
MGALSLTTKSGRLLEYSGRRDVMFGLAEILAVPPALSAALELARNLRHRTGTAADEASNAKLETSLKSVLERMISFTQSRVELFAWKQIHHITNHVDTDLSESFAMISSGQYKFIENADGDARRIIIRSELTSLRRSGAPVPELKIFISKEGLMKAAIIPDSIYGGSKHWCNHLISEFESAELSLSEGNMGPVYKSLFNIRDICVNINNYADDKLKEGISEFCDVSERLNEMLLSIRGMS